MKKISSQLNLIALVIFLAVCNNSFAQVFNQPTENLPPCPDSAVNSEYIGSQHQIYGGQVDFSNPSHYAFTNCFAPPANIGDTTVHTFGSMAMGTITITGGPTFGMVAPAQTSVQVIFISQNGNIKTFANEMTQLVISGGNLPPLAMIRESPTHATTGMTTIENVGGVYNINSYFDVWTDLSLDSGATWIPCDTSGRMTLVDYPLNIISQPENDFQVSVSPNPFENHCGISFTGKNSEQATLQVFDITGKLISTLLSEKIEKGKFYSLEFDGTKLPTGIYFYKFSSSANNTFGKLVLTN